MKKFPIVVANYAFNSKMQANEALGATLALFEELSERINEASFQEDIKAFQDEFDKQDMASNRKSALELLNNLLDASCATREERKRCISSLESAFQCSESGPYQHMPRQWCDTATLREKNHQVHLLWMNELVRQKQLECEKEEKEKKLQALLRYRAIAMSDITKTRTKQFTRQQENQMEKRHLKMISDLQFAIDDFNRERKMLSKVKP